MVKIYDNRPQLQKDFENDIHNMLERYIKEILKLGREVRQKQEFFINCGTGLSREKSTLKELTSIEKIGDIMLDVHIEKQKMKVEERTIQTKKAKTTFEWMKKQLRALKAKHKKEIQDRKMQLTIALEKEREKLAREKATMESL